MHRRNRNLGWPLRLLASVMGMSLVFGGVVPALAQQPPEPVAGWTVATLPADWMQIRDRWATFHAARTFVTLGGLAASVAGCLLPAGRAEELR